MKLKHGDIIYHVEEVNADGTSLRARITGKPISWKRMPDRFRVPWKHGLYTYGSLTEHNNHHWSLEE